MEFLTEYGLFAAKFLTVLGAVLGAVLVTVIVSSRNRADPHDHLVVKKLNDKLDRMAHVLNAATLPPKELKKLAKEKKKAAKARPEAGRPRVFLIRFHGDLRATGVSQLRQEISAVLEVAQPEDEVVVALESGGGTIHGYGLASSQLKRVRDRGHELTVIVDKVAASGGYMMACVGSQVLAAPFAVIGSIGVVMQLPNFNRLLKANNVDFEMVTAGEYKRTLTFFGENTEQGREKVREELEEAHGLFKDFIKQFRPQVDIDAVATGEHWFGTRALELDLVDGLRTSDDYLMDRARDRDVYEVSYKEKRNWLERIAGQGADALVRAFN